MASILLPCPSCKRQISSSAHSCPHCGEPLSDEWEAKGRTRRKRRRIVCAMFVVPPLLFVTSAVIVATYEMSTRQAGPQIPPPPVAEPASRKELKAAALPPANAIGSPGDVPYLTKLGVIFVGRPPQSEIKELMDQVLASYGQPSSATNYELLGNALIGMRKNTRVTEMSLLRCMPQFGPTLKQDFLSGVALCAFSLEGKSG
jgi:predicted RNA-binding Zn-ribbon protein involved in translation (DUF1610 family)